VAFNLAFEAFGLPYRWDEDIYGRLLRITGGQARLQAYLAEQGMPEAERDELVPALHARKTAMLSEMVAEGVIEVRPGVRRLLDELTGAGCRLAVATTGSRGWVDGLLAHLLPGVELEVVVTGDEVSARKPDPEAFVVAVERLGVDGAAVVAVEDSAEGLEAAKAAGLTCVVVTNGYTADHDLAAADLVLDGFGEPGSPATVTADPLGVGCDGIVDVDVLERVLAKASQSGGSSQSDQ
jgi:HAD superfamily hydrolase (TIGR01509 family)